MFFGVFRFAKNTNNFLLKYDIHFFSMRIFRVQFRFISQVPRLIEFLDIIYFVQTPAQSNAHAQLCYQGLCQPSRYLWYIHPRTHSIVPTTNVCVVSGDEERVSKRARKLPRRSKLWRPEQRRERAKCLTSQSMHRHRHLRLDRRRHQATASGRSRRGGRRS